MVKELGLGHGKIFCSNHKKKKGKTFLTKNGPPKKFQNEKRRKEKVFWHRPCPPPRPGVPKNKTSNFKNKKGPFPKKKKNAKKKSAVIRKKLKVSRQKKISPP